jgi:hypothetical protein
MPRRPSPVTGNSAGRGPHQRGEEGPGRRRGPDVPPTVGCEPAPAQMHDHGEPPTVRIVEPGYMDPSSRGHANEPRGIGRRASSDLTSSARLDPLKVATRGRRGCADTGGYRQIAAPDGPGGTSVRRGPMSFGLKRSGTWAGHPTAALTAGASDVPSTIGTDGPLVVPEPVHATRSRATNNVCLPLTPSPTGTDVARFPRPALRSGSRSGAERPAPHPSLPSPPGARR